jgi:hypothetical protein
MKSKQDDGLQSLHDALVWPSAPSRLADANHSLTAAAAASEASAGVRPGLGGKAGMSPPSSGSAVEGSGLPPKRDDSRDVVSSPRTPKGALLNGVLVVMIA